MSNLKNYEIAALAQQIKKELDERIIIVKDNLEIIKSLPHFEDLKKMHHALQVQTDFLESVFKEHSHELSKQNLKYQKYFSRSNLLYEVSNFISESTSKKQFEDCFPVIKSSIQKTNIDDIKNAIIIENMKSSFNPEAIIKAVKKKFTDE